MAGKGGNRQQKQAARAVRRRQAVAAKQQTARQASSPSGRIAAAAACPVERCLRLGDMESAGIGHVILARRLPSGVLGCGLFLVDLFFFGVKDAFYREMPPSELDGMIEDIGRSGQTMVPIDPPSAKKLILGAVAFAAQAGMDPHRNYRTVFRLFDGIDAEAATESFAFGVDGKPVFVPGPNDSPTRMRQVQRALGRRGDIDVGEANAEANLGIVKKYAAALKERYGDLAMERLFPGLTIEHEGSPEPDEAASDPEPPPKQA